jgi:hypothetical protein
MCRLNEQQEAGSGVGSADADVVQAAIDAQGDGADGAGRCRWCRGGRGRGCRDKATPRRPDFQVTPKPAVSVKYGNIILGPPADR